MYSGNMTSGMIRTTKLSATLPHALGYVIRGYGEGDTIAANQARGAQDVCAASRRPHLGSGIRGSLHA